MIKSVKRSFQIDNGETFQVEFMRLRATEAIEATTLLANLLGMSLLTLGSIKKNEDGKIDVSALLKTPGVLDNIIYQLHTLKDKQKEISRLNELFFTRTKFFNAKEKGWYVFEYPGADNISSGYDEIFAGNLPLAIEILVWEVQIEFANFTRLFKHVTQE